MKWEQPALSGVANHDYAPPEEQVDDELGRGGFATVFRGEDRHLPRDVAWKSAPPGEPSRRLIHEARVLSALEHPNIVPVYDLAIDRQGAARVALRIVRGRDLGRRIDEAESFGARLRYLRHLLQAAEAVAWAHERGFVHRDLKPANIMVGEFGETQVIDWGLAIAHHEPEPSEVGLVIGTPQTMSPEQARGEHVDVRADVWSLGATLFHLVLGRPLFPSADGAEIIASLAAGERPAIPRETSAPAELLAIIARALSVDPEGRYPDAFAFAQDIAAFIDGRTVKAHRYRWIDHIARFVVRRRLPLGIGFAAVLAVSIVAIVERDRVLDERLARQEAQERARSAQEERRAIAFTASVNAASRDLALDHRIEAVRAACDALEMREDVYARGVVAAHSRGARVTPIGVSDAHVGRPCSTFEVARSGDILCRTQAGWSVHTIDGGLRSSHRGNHRQAVFANGGEVVVVQRTDLELEVFDVRDGQRLRGPITPECVGRLASSPDGGLAIVSEPNCSTLIDRTRFESIRPCVGTLFTQGITARADGHWAALCRDGKVVSGVVGHPEATRWSLSSLGERIVDVVGMALLASADVADTRSRFLLVGTVHGYLGRIRLDDGIIEASRSVPGAAFIRSVLPEPGDERAFVAFDAGGHDLIDVHSLASYGRLPRSDVGPPVWLGRGLVLTTDSRRRAGIWVVPDGAPDAMDGFGGITALDVGAPDVVAVAHDFAASLASHTSGRLHHRVAWSKNGNLTDISKSVAVMPDGGAVVGTLLPRARLPMRDPGPIRVADATRHLVHLGMGDEATLAVETFARISEIGGPPLSEQVHLLDLDSSLDYLVGIDESPLRTLRIWRFESPLLDERSCVSPDALAAAVRLGPRGIEVLAAEHDGIVTWDMESCRIIDHWPFDEGPIVKLLASPSGRFIAAGTRRGSVAIWDAGGHLKAIVSAHRSSVSALAFEPDERWVMSGAWDGRLRFIGLHELHEPVARVRATLLGERIPTR